MNNKQMCSLIRSSTSKRFSSKQYTFPLFAMFLTTTIFSTFFLGKVFSQQADETTTAFANGRDITEAVIRRIVRSQIFSSADYGFLMRMAYVESKFGTHSLAFRDGYFGGIWAVDQFKLEKTQDLQNEILFWVIYPIQNNILLHFDINWMTVKWEDLLKPLYSGLAAMFFLQINSTLLQLQIPDSINRQAVFWNEYYRFRDETFPTSKFVQESRYLQETNRACRTKINLVIGIDGSSSVGAENFRTFVRDIGNILVQTFHEETLPQTRIGMYVYSNMTFYLFELENDLSLDKMRGILDGAMYPFGDTRTDKALKYGTHLLINASMSTSTISPQVLLIFQEGQSGGVPLGEAIELVKGNDITTIVVGIGGDVNETELLEIGLGNKRNVFTLTGFAELPDLVLKLSSVLCTMPQKPISPGYTYNDTLASEERRYYVLEIANSKGVTVFIRMSVGSVKAYWSNNDEVPSQVVHDGELDGITYIPAKRETTSDATSLSTTGMPIYKLQNSEGMVVYPQKAFLTIEGLDKRNFYDVFTMEGDHDDHSHSSVSSRKIESAIVSSIHYYVFGCVVKRLSSGL